MEKQKLSGKTILKLAGALLALAYLGFCLYAGITGKFPNMHKAEHVMRFGDLKNWVSGGISAVMIFALCITSAFNDLNLQKGRKKSFLPLFLTMILPIILLLLLESYLDIGWIGIALYAGIAVFLFGVAWTPQLLNQWIARRLLRNEPMSGKQQVRIIEWIHFHPLKKLLVFGLWGFGVVLVLRGIWVTATGKIEMDGEHFEPIEFEDEGMKKYLEIYQSQNWMLIGGKLLSKKLALWFTMNRFRNHTSLKVLYLNGMTAKAKVDLDIRGDRYTEFTAVLKELIGYEGTLKLYEKEEQLAQKFASFFPEQTSEQDRVAAFLSQDVTLIRQDYIQTFSPPPDPRKKKRSRRERE